MRDIVNIYRLLDLVVKNNKADSPEAEEARVLHNAFKKGGSAKIDFHIEVDVGIVKDIKIGELNYSIDPKRVQQ